jgi:PKD repeat protein
MASRTSLRLQVLGVTRRGRAGGRHIPRIAALSLLCAVFALSQAGVAHADPLAAFSAPTSAETGQDVTFDASSAQDPTGMGLDYAWTFGDGGRDYGQDVTHVFDEPGVYTVTLTVTDDSGAQSAATQALTITQAPTERAGAGQVSALLFYDGDDFDSLGPVSVQINRGTAVAYHGTVRLPHCGFAGCKPLPQGLYPPGRTARVVDLNADGEPEVLLDLSNGGNICCRYTQIYWWTGSSYRLLTHNWGDSFSGSLVDLDGDGRREFRSSDGRIRYVFDCGGCVAYPIQIWAFDGHRLIDATRRHRSAVRHDAARAWHLYLRDLHRGRAVAGDLATWTADQCNLDRCRAALHIVTRKVSAGQISRARQGTGWPTGRKYLRGLRHWLAVNGYTR